jgi:hypothetical protein
MFFQSVVPEEEKGALPGVVGCREDIVDEAEEVSGDARMAKHNNQPPLRRQRRM